MILVLTHFSSLLSKVILSDVLFFFTEIFFPSSAFCMREKKSYVLLFNDLVITMFEKEGAR